MKYTQEQVLDILKLVTKDPQFILDKWIDKRILCYDDCQF